jgi:hypothetical protein
MDNKKSFLEMAKDHQAGDMLVQGVWDTCSVGCFNREYGNEIHDFEALAVSTGYPEWTHRVQESVFEGLPKDDARNWHVQFAQKMETVKDFDALYHSFMIGVLEVALPHGKHSVIQPVIDLHKNYKNTTPDEWKETEDAANYEADSMLYRSSPTWAAASAANAAANAKTSSAAAAARTAVRAVEVARATEGLEVQGSAVFKAWQKIGDGFLNAPGGE